MKLRTIALLGTVFAGVLPNCPCHSSSALASERGVAELTISSGTTDIYREDFYSADFYSAEATDSQMGKKLRWEDLQKLNYETGEVPADLKALDGKLVSVAGFAVPLGDDGSEKLSEFVLVPQPMMCIHVPPPPPNQILMVKMKEPVVIESLYLPIWMTGTLKIVKPKSEYGDASFEMVGLRVKPYEDRRQ